MYLRELKEQIEELMLERLEEAISVNNKMLKKFDCYVVMPTTEYPEVYEKVGISKMTTGRYNLPLIHDKIDVRWYLYDFPDKNIIPSNLKKQCQWNKKSRTIEVYTVSFNDKYGGHDLQDMINECVYAAMESEMYEDTLLDESNFHIAHRKFIECNSDIEAAIAEIVIANSEWQDKDYLNSDLEALRNHLKGKSLYSYFRICDEISEPLKNMHLFKMLVNIRASLTIIKNHIRNHGGLKDLLTDYTGITEDNLIETAMILENNIIAKIGFNVSLTIKKKENEDRKHVIF